DEAAQPPVRHGRLHLAASLAAQTAMVDADGEILVVLAPQFLEDELGEAARVAEDQSEAGLREEVDDLTGGIFAAVAGPGDAVLRRQDRQIGWSAGLALDQRHIPRTAAGREPVAIGVRIGHGGGETDAAERRANGL